MDELRSANQVIDALGGTAATARLTGKTLQSVSNWRADRRLPSDTYLILTEELKKQNKRAPPRLWGIKTPEAAE